MAASEVLNAKSSNNSEYLQIEAGDNWKKKE
jgi:hypothetical protein